MYSSYMLPCRQYLLCSLILCISFPSIRPAVLSNEFSITLKTPGNTTAPTDTPHKSVHVKYTISNDKDQLTIVGFEPILQTHKNAVELLTVHLCDLYIEKSIWFNDEIICNGAQSMLIYEWTPYSSLSPFRISDDCGFELKKSTSVVLTVIYKKRKQVHKEQSGIILFLSIQSPRLLMGTMLIGDKQKGTHFSCRSSNFPRLLYGIKKLNSNGDKRWWRIHVIRVRQFGRKLVESVFDSKTISNKTQTYVEIVPKDLFLMKGDYLLIECENISPANCYFLLYYTHKSKLIKNDNICQNDSFTNLFKLISSKEMLDKNQTTNDSSIIDGSTIILLICVLLLIIWISIIVGCIIMRRIRGLVNFRTEPLSIFTPGKNRCANGRIRAPHDGFQHRTGEADNINQIDADQGGGNG